MPLTTKISVDTLRQLHAVNMWLNDVFGEGARLSGLLCEAGVCELEIENIKKHHLTQFVKEVVNLIVKTTDHHDGERRNGVMVRHYGLVTGQPETLQSIGNSLELSRERIRQLVKKRIQLYRHPNRKEHFKEELTAIARRILDSRETRD